MGNRYRFTLGYKRISADLLPGATTGTHLYWATYNVRIWRDVVKPGKIYETYFEQTGTTGAIPPGSEPKGVGIAYGGFGDLDELSEYTGFISRWFPNTNGFYIYRNVCLEGTHFYSVGKDTRDIANAELYELGWNDPLISIPVGWDGAKLELKRDPQDFAQIEKYTSVLNFVGDGFDYLHSVLINEGRSAIVPVKIEKLVDWCSPYASNLIYETIYEGVIYLNKTIFKYFQRSVEVSLEDSSAGAILTAGKNIQTELIDLEQTLAGTNNYFFTVQGLDDAVETHNAAGAYPTGYTIDRAFSVFKVLRALVRAMSEGKVDVRSDFFSQTYPYLEMIKGAVLWAVTANFPVDGGDSTILSFQDAFNNLDKIMNLAIGFEKDGKIPIIRIEPKSYFEQSGEVVELDGVREMQITAPKETNYRVLDIGYKKKWDDTLLQNVDKGDIITYSSGNVADDVHLDLVTDWVTDGPYILYALKSGVDSNAGDPEQGSADIDDNIILIECDLVGGFIKSKQVTAGEYNHTLHPIDNFNRWLQNLPTEVFAHGDSGRDKGAEFRNKNIKFSFPLTMKDFNKLTNPTAKIRLLNSSQTKSIIEGITMSVSRNMKTGIADIEILTS